MTLRIVTFNGLGWPAQPQPLIRADLERIRAELDPDLIAVQEFWYPRFMRCLARVFPGFGRYSRAGWSGSGVTWRAPRFSILQTGSVRLHRSVWIGRRCTSSARRITYAVVHDTETGRQIVAASTHFTTHGFNPAVPQAGQAWQVGAEHLVAFLADMVTHHGHVALGLDANADHARLVEALGTHIAGQPVRVISNDPTAIDHLVLVGPWEVGEHGRLTGVNSDHHPFYLDCEPK